MVAGLSLPRVVGASWPFSVSKAKGAATRPILHDASIKLLTAPLSTNVADELNPSSLTTPDGSALVAGVNTASSTPLAVSSDTTDTITVPASGTISQYTVKAGDSLSTIAQNFGVSVNTILWANNITDKSTIKTGTVLVILPVTGVEHTVRSGETLSSIAKKFNADANDIAQFNGLANGSPLQSGSVIIIPGGELSVAVSKPNIPAKTPTASTKTKDTKTSPSSSKNKELTSPSATHAAVHTSSAQCDYSSGNPCHGINGQALKGFFTNPVPGGLITQGLHGWDAVDLGAPTGTSIHAAASGVIILSRVGGWNGGYGNYVIIDNGQGVETLYSHMSQIEATVGDHVSAGQVIGSVGRTGDATGSHLHFEVRGAQNPFALCEVGSSSSSCI